MTMPRKNRRNLVVDGVKYYWIDRNGTDHWLNRGQTSGRITIQRAPGRGSCLFLEFLEYPTLPVLADAIRFALKHGWLPTQNKPFYLGYSDSPIEERFVIRSKDSEPLYKGPVKETDPKRRVSVNFDSGPLFESLPTRLAASITRNAVQEYLGPPERHDEQRDLFLLTFHLVACRVLLVNYNTDGLVQDYCVMRVALADYQQFPNPLVEMPLPAGLRLPNAEPQSNV